MEDDAHPATPITGSLRVADGQGIVHIETELDRPVDDVWSALVVPERLARWLGEFGGELRPAGTFDARFFASEWQGTGRVERCEAPSRLCVRMTNAENSEVDTMEVTLVPAAQRTGLVVEQRGVRLDQLAAFAAGLQVHVEDLAAYLAGRGRCDAVPRWKELFPVYQARAVDPA